MLKLSEVIVTGCDVVLVCWNILVKCKGLSASRLFCFSFFNAIQSSYIIYPLHRIALNIDQLDVCRLEMVLTKDIWLPSDAELTVEEVPLGTPSLRAGAMHLGKVCEVQNNEFMLCRSETQDPR